MGVTYNKINKKMELQTAIEILEYHQEWRLGKREDMIYEPKKLTEALDIVISEVKKHLSKLVQCRNCNEEVQMVSNGEFCPKCFCE